MNENLCEEYLIEALICGYKNMSIPNPENLEVVSKLEMTEQGRFIDICYKKGLHFCEQTTKRGSRMSQRQKQSYGEKLSCF